MNVYIPAITLSRLLLALLANCILTSIMSVVMWQSYFRLPKPRSFPILGIIATLLIVFGWICFLLAANILPPLP